MMNINAPKNNDIESPCIYGDEDYGAIEKRKRAKRTT
jgi:hypothetical protein